MLPEHVADAVFALTGGDLTRTTGLHVPGRLRRRGGLPAVTAERTFAAVDLGASSGRVMVARVGPDRLDLHEVHRFPNRPVRTAGTLHWDVLGLYAGVLDGLRAAGRDVGRLDGVGIDSWAVDYGLLDADGALLGNPVHYRDARHETAVPAVHAAVAAEELYRVTGLQHLPFNTVFQLAARAGQRPAGRRPAAAADPRPARRTG